MALNLNPTNATSTSRTRLASRFEPSALSARRNSSRPATTASCATTSRSLSHSRLANAGSLVSTSTPAAAAPTLAARPDSPASRITAWASSTNTPSREANAAAFTPNQRPASEPNTSRPSLNDNITPGRSRNPQSGGNGRSSAAIRAG